MVHCIYYGYSYLPDSSLSSCWVDTDVTNGKIHYNYDTYKRVTSKVYDFYVKGASTTRRFTNTVSYTFSTNGKHGSAQVASYTSGVNKDAAVTSTYTYDGNGNITKIALSNGQEYRYVYDDLGQLLREDNSAKSRTYVYSYDHAGNILSKKTYALTAEGETPSTLYSTNTYGYNDADWGDLLTSFNGHTITYDAIGNPLNYYNGSSFSFTWKNGRQLATAAKGTYVLSYDYNDEGIRTKKVVNGVEHTYYLSGSQIVAEEWGSNLCVYLYDADGSPIGMQYRTTSMAKGDFYTFWFEKNLQGDIVAVYNESGTKVYTYQYDAWGNCTATPVSSIGSNIYAQYNPFRYRGYYYDSELGMYYLQSRYYDPAVGRFINADESDYLGTDNSLIGYNLFAYCDNNPVMNIDPSGTFSWKKLSAIVAVTAIIVVSVVATVATFGAASVAGTIAITSAITIAAKATEVAVLQGKKSTQDGDDASNVIDDMVNSVFDNGAKIIGITPATKAIGFGSGFYSQSAPFQDSLELMKLDGSLKGLPGSAAGEFINRFRNAREFLSMPTSKMGYFISYGFAAIAVGDTIYSCFASDPAKRAAKRGYSVK